MANLSKGISLKNGATGLTNIPAGSKYSLAKAPAKPANSSNIQVPIGGYNPAQVAKGKSSIHIALNKSANKTT